MPTVLTGCFVDADVLTSAFVTVRTGADFAAGLVATFAAGFATGLAAPFVTVLDACLGAGTDFLTGTATGLTGFLDGVEALTADFAALTEALPGALAAGLAGTFAEVFEAGLAAAIVFLMPVDWVMIALLSLRYFAQGSKT